MHFNIRLWASSVQLLEAVLENYASFLSSDVKVFVAAEAVLPALVQDEAG